MLRAYRKSYADALASYDADKRRSERSSDLPSYLLYRPLSFVVTPLFALCGFSANGATLSGLLVALLMPLAAAYGGPRAGAMVALLALVFQVLDCVDGNLARMQGSSSRVGEMLDSLTSLFFWALYFVAVGVATERSGPSFVAQHGLELGLALALMLLAQREAEDTFESYCGERVRWSPPSPAGPPRLDLSRFGRVIEQVLAFLGLALFAEWRALDLFMSGVLLWQSSLLALWLVRFAARVRERMGPTPTCEPAELSSAAEEG